MINKPTSHFSYLVRPTTPCVFGREASDGELQNNDDEFFLTAGAIIHSCPNIHELSIENSTRKLHSCEHFQFLNSSKKKPSINDYYTEFDRYSIQPRFQPISSSRSFSTDSLNSEIELYKERHAYGLSRNYETFLQTTWKSDNYLMSISVLQQRQNIFFSISNKKKLNL